MKLLQERHGCAANETSTQAADLLDFTADPFDRGAELEAPLDSLNEETLDAEPLPADRLPTRSNSSREKIRRKKVSAIRHQFQLGQYEVESRLEAILDKLLDDLIV